MNEEITPDGRPRRSLSRLPAVALIAGLLTTGIVIDQTAPKDVREPAPSLPTPIEASAASAPSSTWFCPVGLVRGAGASFGAVHVANLTDQDAKGTVTILGSEGAVQTVPVDVKGLSTATVDLAPLGKGDVGVVAEFDRGGITVEHSISNGAHLDVAQCSSRTSRQWSVADGSTSKGDRTYLVVMNPFADAAVMDMKFVAPQVDEEGNELPDAQQVVLPKDLQGFVVPARSTVAVDVANYLRRRPSFGATIQIRRGAATVEKLEIFDDSDRSGVLATLAAPSPQKRWRFPNGYASKQRVERYSIYNPTETDTSVDVLFANDREFVEPQQLRVPAGRRGVAAPCWSRVACSPRVVPRSGDPGMRS